MPNDSIKTRVAGSLAARIGGITPWLKVADLAESFNVSIYPHFLRELQVSLSAAVPNAQWVEYIPQLDDVTHSRIQIQDGFAVPPSTPGLGIDWNWPAIKNLSIAKRSAGAWTMIGLVKLNERPRGNEVSDGRL